MTNPGLEGLALTEWALMSAIARAELESMREF